MDVSMQLVEIIGTMPCFRGEKQHNVWTWRSLVLQVYIKNKPQDA